MLRSAKFAAILGVALVLAACASTKFTSTWKNPGASPLGSMKGRTIVAMAMVEDEYLRRGVEEALVYEMGKRGAQGIASYTILPPGIKDEALAKAAFEKAGAAAAVVMRPMGTNTSVSVSSSGIYSLPSYGGFWGGYWGYGWGVPYTTVQTSTHVFVETLFYSLEQNKLIWMGQSKTTDPPRVARFVKDLVTSAVWEMDRAKVF